MNAHLLSLSVHIGAGTIALALGFAVLSRAKGTADHKRLGRVFSYLTLVVCLSAAVGLVLFRFLPIFAVLTVLVLYQLGSGWHTARTQANGPSALDAAWTVAATAASLTIIPFVSNAPGGSSSVSRSTLAALATVLLYDTVRWLYPRRWHRIAWRYEHTYKMIAATFGMLSALVGNVVRVGQPWSQLAPSALGATVAMYFFFQLYREDSAADR